MTCTVHGSCKAMHIACDPCPWHGECTIILQSTHIVWRHAAWMIDVSLSDSALPPGQTRHHRMHHNAFSLSLG